MRKIFTNQQLRAWDKHTLQQKGIPSVTLMNQASEAFVKAFTKRYTATHEVSVWAGIGNNGGDGLRIAQLLHKKAYKVHVYLTGDILQATAACQAQHAMVQALGLTVQKVQESNYTQLPLGHIVIEALIGLGESGDSQLPPRPLENPLALYIDHLNKQEVIRIAVDRPAGLTALKLDEFDGTDKKKLFFHAHRVIAFQSPDLFFLLEDDSSRIGEWEIVDIGLSEEYHLKTHSPYKLFTKEDAMALAKHVARTAHAHKQQVGSALLIAGSQGMWGAAALAAQACLRTGVGVLHTHVSPGAGEQLLHALAPESLLHLDHHALHFTQCHYTINSFQAIGIGPGLGTHFPTANGVRKLLKMCEIPMVIDADALNILAAYPELLQEVPPGSLLTPHIGEFRRLAGDWTDNYQRLAKQKDLAKRTQCVVVLKGRYTSVAYPDGSVSFNTTGTPAMATAGAGDVLTGMLLGLLAQGLSAEQAAPLGVWMHGNCGNMAEKEWGTQAVLARDLVQQVGKCWQELLP